VVHESAYCFDNLHIKLHVTMSLCSNMLYTVYGTICCGQESGLVLIGICGVLGFTCDLHVALCYFDYLHSKLHVKKSH
jgi:hypothetical protein